MILRMMACQPFMHSRKSYRPSKSLKGSCECFSSQLIYPHHTHDVAKCSEADDSYRWDAQYPMVSAIANVFKRTNSGGELYARFDNRLSVMPLLNPTFESSQLSALSLDECHPMTPTPDPNRTYELLHSCKQLSNLSIGCGILRGSHKCLCTKGPLKLKSLEILGQDVHDCCR